VLGACRGGLNGRIRDLVVTSGKKGVGYLGGVLVSMWAAGGLGQGGGGDAGSSPSRAGLEECWEPAGAV
jgi:hypothetical protein